MGKEDGKDGNDHIDNGIREIVRQAYPKFSRPTKKQYKDFLEFLETAVASDNLKKNDPAKWEEYKKKLDKERFLKRLNVRK